MYDNGAVVGMSIKIKKLEKIIHKIVNDINLDPKEKEIVEKLSKKPTPQ